MPALLCPTCGKTVPADAPGEVCPACLMRLGFGFQNTLPPQAPTAAPDTIGDSAPESTRDDIDRSRSAIGIPGYEILSELGRGGMGVVYKARHLQLKRLVALKMIVGGEYAVPAQLERFRHEAEAVARLQHPNIVQIYEVGACGGQPYCALEFVDGGSLADKLHGTPLPAAEAARIVETLALAVHAAHQRGIVHRDLKPGNVLLTADGTPKIVDFGLAKETDGSSSRTQEGTVVGTPSYMAPEQASGISKLVGPAADTYALGAILYETLTGRPPFKGVTPLDTILQVASLEPAPPSGLQPQVPRDLETICLKCLHKEPARRYASALALAEDLHRFQTHEPIQARPTSALERLMKWSRRHPAAAGLDAALAVVFLTAFALVTWNWQEAARAGMLDRQLAEREGQRAQKEAEAKEKADEAAREAEKRAEAEKQRAEAEKQRAEAEGQRATAQHQRAEAEKRTAAEAKKREDTERKLREEAEQISMTAQIWRAAGLNDHDPLNALRILENPRLCPTERRDFAWRYQYQLSQRRLKTMAPLGQGRYGYHSTISPSAKLVAAVIGNMVQVWDLDTGDAGPLLDGGHRGTVATAISPNGKLLATGGEEGVVKLWDLPEGKLRSTLRWQIADDKEKPRHVHALVFDPSGKKLAVGGHYHDKTKIKSPDSDGRLRYFVIWVWDVGTGAGKMLTSHDAYKGDAWYDQSGIMNLAYSPDGKTLAAGLTRASAVWLFDADTGARRAKLREEAGWINCMAFSPDGQLLAVGNHNNNVHVYNLDKFQLRHSLNGHQREITDCVFTKDGALVTGSYDGTLRVWDPRVGELRTLFRTGFSCVALRVRQADGQIVVLTTNDVQFWLRRALAPAVTVRVTVPQYTARHAFSPVAFDEEGERCATAGPDNQVRLVKVTRLLAAGDKRPAAAGHPWFAKVTAQAEPVLAGHKARATVVAFGPAGSSLIAAGAEDGKIHLWRLRGDKQAEAFKTLSAPGEVFYLALLPDGKSLVSAANTKGSAAVVLWNLEDEKAQPIAAGPGMVSALALSKDGKRLATYDPQTGRAHVWDLEARKVVQSLTAAPPALQIEARQVRPSLAWNADGTQLAVLFRTGLMLHDLKEGTARPVFLKALDTNFLGAMAATGDLKTVAAVCRDRTVRVYDVLSGHLRAELPVVSHSVYGVAFNRDATILATFSPPERPFDTRGEIKIWATAPR